MDKEQGQPKLLEEFNAMRRWPGFELTDSASESRLFKLEANAAGIAVLYTNIFQSWDEMFTLDEHLEAVVERVQNSI